MNVFLPGDVDKWDLHMLHWTAWEKGVKSLYYCRSKSVQRAGFAGGAKAETKAVAARAADNARADAMASGESGAAIDAVIAENLARAAAGRTDYDECLACQ